MARLSKRLFLFLLSLSMLALGLGSPVTVLAAPANDNFDNAAAITSLPFAGVVNPVAARWFASSQIS